MFIDPLSAVYVNNRSNPVIQIIPYPGSLPKLYWCFPNGCTFRKFHRNPSTTFWVILFIHRQTNWPDCKTSLHLL